MWPNSMTAASEITSLQNLTLLRELDRLSRGQTPRPSEDRAELIARLVVQDVIKGGWPGRRRFAVRAARSLAYRLFGWRGGAQPPAQPSAAATEAEYLPIHYWHLNDVQRDWRQASLSACVRDTAPSPTARARRRTAEASWQRFIAARPQQRFLQQLAPHRGGPGPLRILVLLGGGGLGDALMFSAFLAALGRRFPGCEILLLFQSPVVEALYAGNPTVACAVSGAWSELQDIALSARWLGMFDMVVDVFCFLPRYLPCAESRIDLDRHGAWLEGNAQLGDIIERFSSNLGMALLDRALNVHVFDLLASIGGLALQASSPLIFSPDPRASDAVRDRLDLPEQYVTIRDGCNPGDLAQARQFGKDRSTKQLPAARWPEICRILHGLGLAVVQVGDRNDAPVAGADVDLRGRTSLSELCFVMKRAVAHVDTEGGLAHFARASQTPAVVMFGTTSKVFFGYPQNLNLASDACGRCWYSSPTWLAQCPRGTEGPLCTASLDLAPLTKYLRTVMASRRRAPPRLLGQSLFVEADAATLPPVAGIGAWAVARARAWGKQAGKPADWERRLAIVSWLGHLEAAHDIVEITCVGTGERQRGSVYNFPADTAQFDAMVCIDLLAQVARPEAAAAELQRLIAAEGLLLLAQPQPVGADTEDRRTQALRAETGFEAAAVAASARALQACGLDATGLFAWSERRFLVGARADSVPVTPAQYAA